MEIKIRSRQRHQTRRRHKKERQSPKRRLVLVVEKAALPYWVGQHFRRRCVCTPIRNGKHLVLSVTLTDVDYIEKDGITVIMDSGNKKIRFSIKPQDLLMIESDNGNPFQEKAPPTF